MEKFTVVKPCQIEYDAGTTVIPENRSSNIRKQNWRAGDVFVGTITSAVVGVGGDRLTVLLRAGDIQRDIPADAVNRQTLVVYVRAGDGDNYNEFSSIADAGDYLAQMRATPYIERVNEYGVACDGYRGQNYISVYWGIPGDTDKNPVCGLTDDEIKELGKEIETSL